MKNVLATDFDDLRTAQGCVLSKSITVSILCEYFCYGQIYSGNDSFSCQSVTLYFIQHYEVIFLNLSVALKVFHNSHSESRSRE